MKLKVIGIGIAILGILLVAYKVKPPALGSITEGQAYYATSTSASFSNRKIIVKAGPTIFGSVVITKLNNVVLTIMDATSTTDIASTTVAQFVGNAAVGTYTFDAQLQRGLSVDTAGSWDTGYTITYK